MSHTHMLCSNIDNHQGLDSLLLFQVSLNMPVFITFNPARFLVYQLRNLSSNWSAHVIGGKF